MSDTDAVMSDRTPKRQIEYDLDVKECKCQIKDKISIDIGDSCIVPVVRIVDQPNSKFSTICKSTHRSPIDSEQILAHFNNEIGGAHQEAPSFYRNRSEWVESAN